MLDEMKNQGESGIIKSRILERIDSPVGVAEAHPQAGIDYCILKKVNNLIPISVFGRAITNSTDNDKIINIAIQSHARERHA